MRAPEASGPDRPEGADRAAPARIWRRAGSGVRQEPGRSWVRRQAEAEAGRLRPELGSIRALRYKRGGRHRRRVEGTPSRQAAARLGRLDVVVGTARLAAAVLRAPDGPVRMRPCMRGMVAAGSRKEARDDKGKHEHGHEPPPYPPPVGSEELPVPSCSSLPHGSPFGFSTYRSMAIAARSSLICGKRDAGAV